MGDTELVVFDLDGTLVDSLADIVAALNRGLMAVGGRPLGQEQIVGLVGRPLVEIFASLLPDPLKTRANQAAEVYRRSYFDRDTYSSRIYPGVTECLEGLCGIQLAIATTKPTNTAVRVIKELGLVAHFALIQGSENLPTKPDPAVLKQVIDSLGADPEKSWMVGDTVLDIQAGQRAGMRTCAVTYGFGEATGLSAQRPDLLLDSLEKLPALL